jgi:DNA-binding response OmpR family regulator
MLADALVERGFEVLTAVDAEEGLRLLVDEILTLDLLVTDQFLPGALGEEFVERIRREGGEGELLITVVTASPDGDLAERLRRAGADLLLGKDLGPEIIAMKADTLLRARVAGLPERGLRPGPSNVGARPSTPAEQARP